MWEKVGTDNKKEYPKKEKTPKKRGWRKSAEVGLKLGETSVLVKIRWGGARGVSLVKRKEIQENS